ncbi:hypothetical protein BX666DRAFT_1873953 [Dichotomocladium elegans]|nr:hypothetical protein BX666DRAFT_1873953 [Dichotomocladium elegans]
MTDISFEHFDPEIELCNVDENGRPIRPRKKPGRKPNPPSPAQRKAQNRAAQRAFRERKRREMREAEASVKRAHYVRDQALSEVNKLRRRVKDLEYENKYLKGFVLTLKLTCNARRIDVPNYSDTGARDELGNENFMVSGSKTMPQKLEFFLNRNGYITSLQDDNLPKNLEPQSVTDSTYASSPSSHSVDSSIQSSSSLDQFLLSPQLFQKTMPGSFDFGENQLAAAEPLPPLDLTQTATALLPQLSAMNTTASQLGQLDSDLLQTLIQTDLVSTFIDQVTRPEFTIDQTPPELASLIPPEWRSSLHEFNIKSRVDKTTESFVKQEATESSGQWNDSDTSLNAADDGRQGSTTSAASAPRYTIGPNNERIYPPMTPMEFVHEMRTIQRTDKKTWAFFEPTELQRNVPHDIRIDIIPGAVMRDQMILFQDYYDANELFSFLFNSSMFLGGSPGNQDHWFVPPSFLRKYWFLCPNQKPPNRMDNSVDIVVYLGQRLEEMMAIRRQMYLNREKYAEHFPEVHSGGDEEEDQAMEGVEAPIMEDDQTITEDMPIGSQTA